MCRHACPARAIRTPHTAQALPAPPSLVPLPALVPPLPPPALVPLAALAPPLPPPRLLALAPEPVALAQPPLPLVPKHPEVMRRHVLNHLRVPLQERTEASRHHHACEPVLHCGRQVTHVVQLSWRQLRQHLRCREVLRLGGAKHRREVPHVLPIRRGQLSRLCRL